MGKASPGLDREPLRQLVQRDDGNRLRRQNLAEMILKGAKQAVLVMAENQAKRFFESGDWGCRNQWERVMIHLANNEVRLRGFR
jgi:hypothetical protein